MSSLESTSGETSEAPDDETAGDEGTESPSGSAARTVDLDAGDVRLSVPESATPAEAAAISAAVGAHRTDRRRAAAAAAAADDEAERASRWKVASRLPEGRAATLPREVERESIWRAASRSL